MKKILVSLSAIILLSSVAMAGNRQSANKLYSAQQSMYMVWVGTWDFTDSLDVWTSSWQYTPRVRIFGWTGAIEADSIHVSTIIAHSPLAIFADGKYYTFETVASTPMFVMPGGSQITTQTGATTYMTIINITTNTIVIENITNITSSSGTFGVLYATHAYLANVQASTTSLQNQINAISISSGSQGAIIAQLSLDTATLRVDLDAVAASTGNFYTKGSADALFAVRTATDSCLPLLGTAADSSKFNGQPAGYYALATATDTARAYGDITYAVRTATDSSLGLHATADNASKLNNQPAGFYALAVATDSALGLHATADDSNKLGNQTPSYYATTASTNSLGVEKANRAEVQTSTNSLESRKMDKTGGTFTGDVVVGTLTATVIYAEDVHVSSITIITQKSTETLTDYLGSENYDNVKMTNNLNLQGYKLYGGVVDDVGIQGSTTALRDQDVLIGQATGQGVVRADMVYAPRTATDTFKTYADMTYASRTSTNGVMQDSLKLNGQPAGYYALATATDSSRAYGDITYARSTATDTVRAYGDVVYALRNSTNGVMSDSTKLNGQPAGYYALASATDSARAYGDIAYARATATDTARAYGDITYAVRTATNSTAPDSVKLNGQPAGYYALATATDSSRAYGDITYAVRTATNVVRSYGDVVYAVRTATNSTAPDSVKLNGQPASYYATTEATGTITDQGLKTTNSPTFANVTGNLIQTGVQYSTVTIVIPFISTGVTQASMIGQVVDIPCIGTDYIIKSWCCIANTAGTFTVTISTAVYSNTPSFGSSIMNTSSPNLVSTMASSGTVTGAGTVPAGGFMRAVCNTATVVENVTANIVVWIRK